MNCRVVVEAAVPVYDVETENEAIRIGISKTGEMLNPDLNYVEINMGTRTSPSGEELEPAFIAADEALVALELEMTVFNVEREEHASRIARKEIGQRLENIPLEVLRVEVIEDEDDTDEESESTSDSSPDDDALETADETAGDGEGSGSNDSDSDANEPSENDEETTATSSTGESSTDDEDDDVLPEFEELLE
ncbi:hypothetical protein HALLA_16085 [Halostagnicola larsenii XH-48]|uniref:UPF0212 protein HALLA_16085 n=1 Tax=Halostagnicola larsenii XH-48 TaxID=797299 RepID=W0JNB6_9EURY|nr:DUF555 domain-containing protein [Halostagnicola larsenii]AHG00094.1 hypothetical protein HALLA_16085 [Halostagnicola larsenii XH-48]